MLPINKKISRFNNSGRNGNSVKYIVMHYTGNKGDTAKNNVDYFYNGNRNASAHYFVDDKSIWQSVEESRAAWAVGDGRGRYGITNQNSISIEMCCNLQGVVSETTENNALELAKYLVNKYGLSINRVVRHYDASRKACPNWSEARWQNFKAKLAGQKVENVVVSTPAPAPAPSNPYKKYADFVGSRCKELQTKLNKVGYNCGQADGIFGQNTYNALIKFQSQNGLAADGLAGERTFAKLNELIAKQGNKTSFNNWVARLQAECNNQGFSNQAVDGIPGKVTLAACPMLRKGARGNITKLLQERLNALGYSTNGIDGIFGSGTYKAVKAYQSAKGIACDGIVGQGTWKKLLGL